jgi:hypothetical protein
MFRATDEDLFPEQADKRKATIIKKTMFFIFYK